MAQAKVGESSPRGADPELPLSRSSPHGSADAFTIAAILGIATIQMRARYAHATDEGVRQAVEKLLAFGHPGRTSGTKQERQIG